MNPNPMLPKTKRKIIFSSSSSSFGWAPCGGGALGLSSAFQTRFKFVSVIMGGNGVICKHSTEYLSLRENKQRASLHIFTAILFPSKVHVLHSAVTFKKAFFTKSSPHIS